MSYRSVIRQLGLLLIVLSGSMVFSAGVALYDASSAEETGVVPAILWSIAIGVGAGLALVLAGRRGTGQIGRREALLLVSLSWFIGCLLAALPFWLWARWGMPDAVNEFDSFVNCYFEAMSGLTTTGATILSDIPAVPRGLLFWRAFTHWLGGLGIVVLFVAVLPLLGVGGKRLFRIETTGVSSEGATPRIVETARVLWFIYVGFTVAEVLLLMLVDQDMTFYKALTHTFATLATGGFSTENASAGAFSAAAQWVMTAFMLLAGVNFALYHQVLRGRPGRLFKDTELRAYLLIIAVASILVFFNIRGMSYPATTGVNEVHGTATEVRDAVFQVVSIQTTTGFCTADFNYWHFFSHAILLALMFVGGCGGSTGGGIKVIRIVVAVKIMWSELERVFRPNVIRPVKVGATSIDESQRLAIIAYVLGIAFIFGIGTALLILTESGGDINLITASTAVIATLNNIGPGLDRVGAVANYDWFSDPGKILLCVLMAVGRLEVFPVMVIFMPRFWRSD